MYNLWGEKKSLTIVASHKGRTSHHTQVPGNQKQDLLGRGQHGAMNNKITAALKGNSPLFQQQKFMQNCT